jgi:hypothetical protein
VGLTRAFEDVFGRSEADEETPALERGFVDEAEDEIDRLFRE